MSLPLNLTLPLMQTQWASTLNPVIDNPISSAILLPNQSLIMGQTSINHRLSQKLTGWIIVRQRGAANIYDNQDGNQQPTLTLLLVSDAAVSVDLLVF